MAFAALSGNVAGAFCMVVRLVGKSVLPGICLVFYYGIYFSGSVFFGQEVEVFEDRQLVAGFCFLFCVRLYPGGVLVEQLVFFPGGVNRTAVLGDIGISDTEENVVARGDFWAGNCHQVHCGTGGSVRYDCDFIRTKKLSGKAAAADCVVDSGGVGCAGIRNL